MIDAPSRNSFVGNPPPPLPSPICHLTFSPYSHSWACATFFIAPPRQFSAKILAPQHSRHCTTAPLFYDNSTKVYKKIHGDANFTPQRSWRMGGGVNSHTASQQARPSPPPLPLMNAKLAFLCLLVPRSCVL